MTSSQTDVQIGILKEAIAWLVITRIFGKR